MVDTQATFQTARKSLEALNAPRTTPSQIKQAERALEEIKTSLDTTSCIQLVELLLHSLLTSSTTFHSIPEIHFGFHLLDELILSSPTPWALFPEPARARVRQIAVTLFQNVSTTDAAGHLVCNYPTLVVEKTVALLSAVAMREWPQRWPGFLDDLLADPIRARTSCQVLRVMSEDLNDYPDNIENARRQELLHAMALTMPKTLQFVTAAAGAFHQKSDYSALNIVLHTLRSFSSWADLHLVFKAGVPTACIALLANTETRDGALAVLATLGRRPFSMAVNSVGENEVGDGNLALDNEFLFRDTMFKGVTQHLAVSNIPSVVSMSPFPASNAFPALAQTHVDKELSVLSDSAEHEFQVAFFDMMCEMGNANFSSTFLFSKRKGVLSLSSVEEQCGAAFVDLMLCAISCPSWSIRMAVLPFFAPVLSAISKQYANGAQMSNLARFLVTGFLSAAALSLVRFPDECDQLRKVFDEEASLDDDGSQREVYENFTARILSNMSAAAKLCPEEGIMPSLSRIAKLLSSRMQQGSNQLGTNRGMQGGSPSNLRTPRSLGLIKPEGFQHNWTYGNICDFPRNVWITAIYAAIMAAEAAIPGAISSETSFDRKNMLNMMAECFRMNMSISDKSFLPLKAHVFRTFWPLYRVDAKSLELCFQTLVSQGSNMDLPSAARFKACLAISTLCRRLGNSGLKKLEDYRRPMSEYCSQAMQSVTFETVNKTLLLEASISTILVSENFEEKTSDIERLLTPVLDLLSSSPARTVLQNPESLFKFLESGVSEEIQRLFEAFQLLEAGQHQVVRQTARGNSPIQGSGLLSRKVAPSSVEICSALVATLHGLYNPTKFPVGDATSARQNALFPTSRELTILLNLESANGYWMRENALDLKVGVANKSKGSIAEQRSNEILKQYGVQPPHLESSLIREALKNLRRSGYEIMRAAILSGVSASPSHAQILVEAVTADCHYIEPIHLVDVTGKILKPLLCYSVLSSGPGFLSTLEKSNLPAMLRIVREHVESAKLGEIIDSDAPLLDLARDYGRKTLARCAADMLASMFPRGEPNKKDNAQVPSFIPPAFGSELLGVELIALWKAVCSIGRGHMDCGGARVGLTLVATAAERAPEDSFATFAPLLEASLNTAVQNVGLTQDSPLNSAIGAVLNVILKWPKETMNFLDGALGRNGDQFSAWISACVRQVTSNSSLKPKKRRAYVRELAEKIALHMGITTTPKKKVRSLPEKLKTNNPARRRNRGGNDDDIILADHALDSLYGDGDPL